MNCSDARARSSPTTPSHQARLRRFLQKPHWRGQLPTTQSRPRRTVPQSANRIAKSQKTCRQPRSASKNGRAPRCKAIDCKTHTFTEATVVHVIAANNRDQEPSSTWYLCKQVLEISTAVPRITQSSATGAHRHENKTRFRKNLRKELRQILNLLPRSALKIKERINDKRAVHMDVGITTTRVKHLDPSSATAIVQFMFYSR